MRCCCSSTILCLFALLLAATGGGGAPAWAQAPDEREAVTRSATFLIQRSVQVRRDGTHHQLLRSLRHLRDPLLKPMFVELAGSSHPALQIHGLLGLAEISQANRLDLRRLAEISDVTVQAEFLSAAMDNDLLSHEQAEQLLAWPGLDLGVRLLAAVRLVEAGRLADPAVLHEGLEATRLARRGLAALMLHQLGEEAGTLGLQALNRRQGNERDAVRAMLLNTALRHGFHRAANWAHAVATEPGVESRLGLLALQAALRFGDPRAAGHWQQQFDSTADAAQRTRLALVALQLAPWLEPGVFRTLVDADNALLRHMGEAGLAIAVGGDDIARAVERLIDKQHTLATGWALHYAATEARPGDASRILLAVINAYEQAPEQQRIRRLDEAVQATQALFELDSAEARRLLRPILTDPKRDAMLIQAILLGLIRSQQPEPHGVIEGIATWQSPDAGRLALLLLARSDQPLTDQQLRDLGILVQGGGAMQDSLRIQAAWSWLRRHGHTHPALAAAIGSI